MDRDKKINQLIEKINKSKTGKLDLSSDEDLSIAIMNLVSLEEHFFFTGSKTQKSQYFEMLREIREMRKELLKKIVKNPEGEVWCISKHLLASSMRLMEVGTKMLGQGKKKEAKDLFSKAYNLYSMFWGINLKVIDLKDVKKIEDGKLNKSDTGEDTIMGKLSAIVKKVIDCCIE